MNLEASRQRAVLRWLVAALLTAPACGQAAEPELPPAAQGEPPSPATPSAPSAPATQQVEITGGRGSDSEQRRQSTAAKIVVGREDIERFGDIDTLEVLKRLPGVTLPGPGARSSGPRLRGMAGGYTQVLVDGERLPSGFSLEAIAPEQIERIEILRAPTAETGARAIAGTINIVLREALRQRLNDLNLALVHQGGHLLPALSWTRNERAGAWVLNGSLSLSERRIEEDSRYHRVDQDLASGATVLEQEGGASGRERRRGLQASSRLQWRGEGGASLLLAPVLNASEGRTRGEGRIDQRAGATPPDYARSSVVADSRFTSARLNLQFNHRLGANGPRLEWRARAGDSRWTTRQQRDEFDAGGAFLHRQDDDADTRDRSAGLTLKALALLGDGHQVVAGAELDRTRRTETRTTLRDGVPQLAEFGDELAAAEHRHALYAQDEWSIDKQWALHAGLRLEGITTEGEGAGGQVARHRSRVTTPLLHAVWKPDPAGRHQLRLSLTRSYRSPSLGQLIGRPSVNRLEPTPGANSELTPDSAGNPLLRPEVALGLDVAVERTLADGNLLSANVFVRRIRDLVRNVVTLEDVSWSPGQPRYVSRPQNIGNALSRGLELEARLRLDQLFDAGPRTELRANASVFRSRVDAVPGPGNRLAEQPGATLNLGADHRWRGTPLTLGANLNFTPGYRTRLDVDRTMVQSAVRVLDAYALWTFHPALKLRLSLSNLLADDTLATTRVDSGGLAQATRVDNRSWRSAQLRLELKL